MTHYTEQSPLNFTAVHPGAYILDCHIGTEHWQLPVIGFAVVVRASGELDETELQPVVLDTEDPAGVTTLGEYRRSRFDSVQMELRAVGGVA